LPETEREPRIEQTDLLISSFGTFFPPCTPSLAIHNYSAKLLKSNSTIKFLVLPFVDPNPENRFLYSF